MTFLSVQNLCAMRQELYIIHQERDRPAFNHRLELCPFIHFSARHGVAARTTNESSVTHVKPEALHGGGGGRGGGGGGSDCGQLHIHRPITVGYRQNYSCLSQSTG